MSRDVSSLWWAGASFLKDVGSRADHTSAKLCFTELSSFLQTFLFCSVSSTPHSWMRMGWCQAVRIISCHVFSLWRRRRSQGNRWEDRSGWRGTRPQRSFSVSDWWGGCVSSAKKRQALNKLTQTRTACGRRGTYCSLGRKRRGRRRSHWQTWKSAGTVYGPTCLTGRPKRRLRTSSPDTQCCLEKGRKKSFKKSQSSGVKH